MEGPRLAKDIMVTKLVTLPPRTQILDGIARLLKYQVTGAPVIDEQRDYLGVFSEKCCMKILTASVRAATAESVGGRPLPQAKNVMTTKLVTVQPEADVFETIGLLLKHHLSGAPVVDDRMQYLGVFSERTSMTVLLDAAYDQLPTSKVEAFMNTDRDRIVDEAKSLLSIAQMFVDTSYRRLPVLRDGEVVGQVVRRDVLRAAYSSPSYSSYYRSALHAWTAGQGGASPAENEEVAAFMDASAKTIGGDADLLAIAQIFRQTPYRRLPVLKEEKLIGQISRRDLLEATYDLISMSPRREKTLLYLSALVNRQDASIE